MSKPSGEGADEHKKPRWERLVDKKQKPRKGWSKYVRTGELYYRETFRKLGIPDLQVATGEKTFGRAKTVADRAVLRWKNKHLGISDDHVFGRDRVTTTFSEVCDKVLQDDTLHWRRGTQAMRQYYIRELREAFGSEDVNAITPERFREQLKKWRRTMRRKTFADFAKYMNVVMRYGHDEMGVVAKLVPFKVKDPQAPPGRVFTARERRALWDAMSEDMRDQFVLAYECIMRLREMLYLNWDRVNLKTGVVTLRPEDVKTGSKTGKGREFNLTPLALERLRARNARRRTDRLRLSPFVFPSKSDPKRPQHDNKTAWNRAKAAAGIDGRARWHDLRHAGFTDALAKGTNIKFLSDYGGASIRTLERIYAHLKARSTKPVSRVLNVLGEE